MNMMKVFDPNNSGTLTDREMQQVMLKTQLDKKICAQVWDLSNPQRDSVFSKSMFLIALHLMYKKRQDPNLQLPERVPQELFVTAEAKGDPALQTANINFMEEAKSAKEQEMARFNRLVALRNQKSNK